MKRSHTIKIMSALLILLMLVGCSKAGGKTTEQKSGKPLTVIRFATSAGNLPINFGIKKGYFAEQGIDLKVVIITGGVEAVTAAAAGEADLGGMGSPIVVGAAAGVPITIVGSPPSSGQHFVLVSKPQYKSFAELKGKPVSPGAPGQGTIQAFNVIAKAKGFKPSDFQTVNAGTSANALAALQTGKVEAVITSETVGIKAELEGFGKILERAVDYFGHYQHSFTFATNRFIKENPDALRKFLLAYRKTVEYLKAHPDEALQFAVTELQQDEIPYKKVYGKEIPTWDTSGRVDFEGTENCIKILKDLGEIDPKVQITAKQIIDEQFLPK
jgi:ABC-type nitrate/sulfonate/bicarbonate transport system substrate-binding protein